jgi:predicted RNase H-like HicB family nuclease
MKTQYIAVVHQDEPDGAFGVSFPHVPGCVAVGDSLDEALANAAEALTSHLQVCLDFGDPVPAPQGSVTRADIDPEGFVLLTHVEVERPAVVKRINISMAEDLLASIDAAASARGLTRSAYLAEGARRLMQEG